MHEAGHPTAFKLVGFVPKGLPPFEAPFPAYTRLTLEDFEEGNHTLPNMTYHSALNTAGQMTTLASAGMDSIADAIGNTTDGDLITDPAGYMTTVLSSLSSNSYENSTMETEPEHTGKKYLSIGEVLSVRITIYLKLSAC